VLVGGSLYASLSPTARPQFAVAGGPIRSPPSFWPVDAGIKCPAWADLDFNKKSGKFGGYCVITDLDGDSAYITWQAAGTPTRFPGTFDDTGGTGKYKDIKGTNTFVVNTVVNWADGTATGYATWNR
jgi:hypothetical protein